MWVVKEYASDGYEDWCVNSTEFESEEAANKFADEVYEGFGGYQAGQRVTVEFER
jgi:hypothetical protein